MKSKIEQETNFGKGFSLKHSTKINPLQQMLLQGAARPLGRLQRHLLRSLPPKGYRRREYPAHPPPPGSSSSESGGVAASIPRLPETSGTSCSSQVLATHSVHKVCSCSLMPVWLCSLSILFKKRFLVSRLTCAVWAACSRSLLVTKGSIHMILSMICSVFADKNLTLVPSDLQWTWMQCQL